MKLSTGASTHQGQIRGNNEDAYLVDDQRAVFAVADGMGGHRGGEVASHTAIEALRAAVASGVALNQAVEQANTAVLERAAGDENLTGMGTTLTAVIVIGGRQLLVAHVGDSRLYAMRDGHLRRVTDDHSLVEEMVRDGRLTSEQAESHPQRAIVTRALGIDSDVLVDVHTLEVEAGDRIMICSDGLTTMIRERDVERVLHGQPDAQHAADALVDTANAAGGEDNITVVVVDVLEVDDAVAPDPTALLPATEVAAVSAVPEPKPAPAVPEPEPPRPKGSRARTVRGAILVIVPLLLILGVAAGALGWYARNSYYVGQNGNQVVIYKGVPGGVLGWDPTVDQTTGINVDQLQPVDREKVAANTSRGSLDSARSYVAVLQQTVANATTTTTTETTSTTTPKKKKRTTTTTTRPGP